MSNFKEFLEDYEAQEKEESEKYIKRLREGKVPYDEIYPSPNRFVKLKQPIAFSTTNIWGEIPFYGSTIIHLVPCHDKESFDEVHNYHGFTSRHIDKMIDFAKETGRIQYLIDNPTYYKNNEFLEPLFHELRPPSPMPIPELFISDTYKKYLIEFDTLAKINFNDFIKGLELFNTITIANNRLGKYAFIYIALKTIGYVELADEIGYLMISNPTEAIRYLQIFADFIVAPHCDTLKSIYNFNREFLTEVHGVGKQHGIDIEKNIPYEIGKFLLNKLVLYPETYEGCMKVIQEYDDYEMHKVFGAIYEGVKRKNVDIIENKKNEMSEVLDNIWKDADKINLESAGISYVTSVGIGIAGELATNIQGTGLLAGLGFQALDRFWGEKGESASERLTKFINPNYLVTIYDFKKRI